MLTFLRRIHAWVLILPLLIGFTGALSNQLVLYANHDRFPVMLNARKIAEHTGHKRQCYLGGLICVDKPADDAQDGMLDDVHCIMTDQTRLNLLADWIDLQDATYSPGDLLLEAGSWMWDYAPLLWVFLMCSEALRAYRD